MPSSKGRKPKAKKEAGKATSSSPPPMSPKTEKPWLSRAGEFLGTVAAIVGLGLFVHDAYHEPEIHVQAVQAQDPFLLHFSLHNPSLFLSMNDMRIACGLSYVEDDKHNEMINLSVQQTFNTEIPAGKTIQYNCPLKKFIGGLGSIIKAKVFLYVKFKTIYHERDTVSEEFNWDATTHQWLEGTIVN